MTDKRLDKEQTLGPIRVRCRWICWSCPDDEKGVKGRVTPPLATALLSLPPLVFSRPSPTLLPSPTHLCPHSHPGLPPNSVLSHTHRSMHTHRYQCHRHLPPSLSLLRSLSLSLTHTHTHTHTFLAFPAAYAPGLAAVIAVVTGIQLAVSLSPGSSASGIENERERETEREREKWIEMGKKD